MEMSTKHAIRIPRMERIGIMQSRTYHSCHQLCKRQKPGLRQRSCNHCNHRDWKARDSAYRRSKTFRIIGRWGVSTSISWISAGKSLVLASNFQGVWILHGRFPGAFFSNWMAWIYWVVSFGRLDRLLLVGLTFDQPGDLWWKPPPFRIQPLRNVEERLQMTYCPEDPPWLDSAMKSNVSRNVFQLTYPEPEVFHMEPEAMMVKKKENIGISFSRG